MFDLEAEEAQEHKRALYASILAFDLTPTEKVILKLVADGKSSNDIAELLFLSSKTVDNHRSHIGKKVGIEGTNSILKFALQHKHLL